ATGKRIRDSDQAAALADAMHRARRWFPAQTLCLIDSIALHRRLRANAIDCALVIGVRDQPFAAHCWVEAGGVLLNDNLDTVGELTPIVRL
ncbi:MAG: lasso peptide biosynthesis B2 protein, partial [Pseudomonadota bacterium]|nr:lasso peptide biosynthesis B2 protein [Pseudomonadota bacterium]